MTNATKVGQKENATQTDKKAKKERKQKPAFNPKKAVDAKKLAIALDEDGRLTGIPTNWSSRFAGLKRSSFAEPAMFFEWKASLVLASIEDAKARAKDLLTKAKEARDGLTPTEKAVRKRASLMKQLEKLDEVIAAEGIEVE